MQPKSQMPLDLGGGHLGNGDVSEDNEGVTDHPPAGVIEFVFCHESTPEMGVYFSPTGDRRKAEMESRKK